MDDDYGNVLNSLIGCSANTISSLHKECSLVRNRMTNIHNYNVKKQILPNIEKIDKTGRKYLEWFPDINNPEKVLFVPWYSPPTYFMSLFSSIINSDGLLFTSKKFLINSEAEYRDFFLKLAQIFSIYIDIAKKMVKDEYNGFSIPIGLIKDGGRGTGHYVMFSCDKDNNFYYVDAQNQRSLCMFRLLIESNGSINIDTTDTPEKDYYLDWYFEKKMKCANPTSPYAFDGFEVFFWIDTYTDNLQNESKEDMYNYISKIANNILVIEPERPFVKSDYANALTFGGGRRHGRGRRTKTMKKGRKTVRRRRRKSVRRRLK